MIRPPSPWALLTMSMACWGLLAVLLIGYVARVNGAAERRNVERQRQICGLIVLLDDRNQGLPVTADPETNRFRTEIHTYRVGLGCP